jgi:hypothetical protein
LSRRKLRRIDLKARPPVTALGPDYIRPPGGLGGFQLLPFPLRARVAAAVPCSEERECRRA